MRIHFQPTALRLYAITPDGAADDPAFKSRVREWLQAGVRAIQLRDKVMKPSDLVPFGRFLRAITSEYGALFIVNDDPHLADLLSADGCHIGQEDMTVERARKILGPDRLLGLSTHDRDQILEARSLDVDYLGVGPIFESSTKNVGRELLGPEFAGWAARESVKPVVGIGGIKLGNVAQLAHAGCTNVAVVGALNETSRPGDLVRSFLDILSSADSARLL